MIGLTNYEFKVPFTSNWILRLNHKQRGTLWTFTLYLKRVKIKEITYEKQETSLEQSLVENSFSINIKIQPIQLLLSIRGIYFAWTFSIKRIHFAWTFSILSNTPWRCFRRVSGLLKRFLSFLLTKRTLLLITYLKQTKRKEIASEKQQT